MHAKLADPATECSLMQEPLLTFSSHPLRGAAWLLRGCQLAICLGVLTEDWLWNATLSHFLLAPLQGRSLHMVWSPHGHYRVGGGLTPRALTPLRYGRTLLLGRIEVQMVSRVSPFVYFTEGYVRCRCVQDTLTRSHTHLPNKSDNSDFARSREGCCFHVLYFSWP